ncbi:MAG: class I SAM-dependent methyltransferase [Candidatus Omnitrophica bacterium]|nr:class I SAM-dependent methyltransferase [Candidatus Omnitrophota bacterium]
MKIKVLNDIAGKEVDIYTSEGLEVLTRLWIKAATHHRLMYEPSWLGIPIIQLAEDIVVMQELIWKLKPDVIVETGIAHGGSAIFCASLLELMGKGKVVAVDVDIRKHNEVAIRSHFLAHRINLIQGSSTDASVIDQVRRHIKPTDRVLVTLDSNHSKAHVAKELELYSEIVTPGSYLVAMDGAQAWVSDIPKGKPEWKDDNPLAAIEDFVARDNRFIIDDYYARLKVTASPKGFLRRLTAAETAG